MRVLITGGSGSLGKALTLNLLATTDATVVVYSRDPHKQNDLKALLNKKIIDERVRFVIGDVRDKNRLHWAMRGCSDVIHAAALKHVDAGEYSPTEFIATNIQGTQNVVETALDLGVERALFISTDKACSAANLYGRTKSVAERLWIRENIYGRGQTKLSAIRYGNVFDSHGSVMENWYEKHPKSVTVRIPDPTRFVCFLSWGVEWVRSAMNVMRGGEIFVPADLSAISMTSLAEELVGWENVSAEPLSAGEKQHEVLIAPEEYSSAVRYQNFYIINPEEPQWKYDMWQGALVDPGFYTSELTDRLSARDFIALYDKVHGDWLKWHKL